MRPLALANAIAAVVMLMLAVHQLGRGEYVWMAVDLLMFGLNIVCLRANSTSGETKPMREDR